MFKLFLNEMAMQWGDNLALFMDNHFFCLYQIGADLRKAIKQTNYEAFNDYVYGVMDVRDNVKYKAWEVERIWTRRGYGPFMYLIAMSVAGGYGLMPTRVRGQITPQAKEVWRQFYEGNGKDLVVPVPIEADHHDEPYLNFKYVIKSPLDIPKMVNKNNITFRQDAGLRIGFYEMAETLLSSQMNDIY